MAAEGSLSGVRVVEVASDHAALAGKMMADLGAEVILVEPRGGHGSRSYGPFVDDEPDSERSLWWWYYHTSKLGVVLDLDDPRDAERFRRLAATSDVVLEGETPGRLESLKLDFDDLRDSNTGLIWVSVTGFGRANPRRHEQFTDLTILAGGAQLWMSGYDDHSLPPVRWGGNQGYHMGSVWAVIAALTALVSRDVTGIGQFVDVSMHAAANVTNEQSNHRWLVSRQEVERQTCRHAAPRGEPTQSTLTISADGRWINTGVPGRSPRDFTRILEWLDQVGLREEFPDTTLLELGARRDSIKLADIGIDPELTEIMRAARDVMVFLASRLPATEFFEGSQTRGVACGPIFSPEEALLNRHSLARGFPVPLHHDDLGRDITYPGAPFIMSGSPWQLSRRAPHLGEHQHLVE
jgi:crotonobetainyl-CoA:carnitine CoA-transferase CaiB-like acyl-CoA transferase